MIAKGLQRAQLDGAGTLNKAAGADFGAAAMLAPSPVETLLGVSAIGFTLWAVLTPSGRFAAFPKPAAPVSNSESWVQGSGIARSPGASLRPPSLQSHRLPAFLPAEVGGPGVGETVGQGAFGVPLPSVPFASGG